MSYNITFCLFFVLKSGIMFPFCSKLYNFAG